VQEVDERHDALAVVQDPSYKAPKSLGSRMARWLNKTAQAVLGASDDPDAAHEAVNGHQPQHHSGQTYPTTDQLVQMRQPINAAPGVSEGRNDGKATIADPLKLMDPVASPSKGATIGGISSIGKKVEKALDAVKPGEIAEKFRSALDIGTVVGKDGQRKLETDAHQYKEAREIMREMQKMRMNTVLKKIASMIHWQQELDAITPELIAQVVLCWFFFLKGDKSFWSRVFGSCLMSLCLTIEWCVSVCE
jgi:hypothetical protein